MIQLVKLADAKSKGLNIADNPFLDTKLGEMALEGAEQLLGYLKIKSCSFFFLFISKHTDFFLEATAYTISHYGSLRASNPGKPRKKRGSLKGKSISPLRASRQNLSLREDHSPAYHTGSLRITRNERRDASQIFTRTRKGKVDAPLSERDFKPPSLM